MGTAGTPAAAARAEEKGKVFLQAARISRPLRSFAPRPMCHRSHPHQGPVRVEAAWTCGLRVRLCLWPFDLPQSQGIT
jgi:hypothetical protein